MSTAPKPVFKGIFVERATGKKCSAFFLKHHADAGETEADDCFITVSEKLEGGEHNSGESGLFPVDQFRSDFLFSHLPNPGKPFGSL